MLSSLCIPKSKLFVDYLKPNRFQRIICPAIVVQTQYSVCAKKGSGRDKVTYKNYQAPCYVDHDQKNMCMNRPMSPHLDIYGPTVTSGTSIFQRASGVILTLNAYILSFGALFLSNGVDSLISIIQSMNLPFLIIIIVKYCLTVPFVFHYFNGIRFVMFNQLKWLELREVYDTAKKVAIITFALSFVLLFI